MHQTCFYPRCCAHLCRWPAPELCVLINSLFPACSALLSPQHSLVLLCSVLPPSQCCSIIPKQIRSCSCCFPGSRRCVHICNSPSHSFFSSSLSYLPCCVLKCCSHSAQFKASSLTFAFSKNKFLSSCCAYMNMPGSLL